MTQAATALVRLQYFNQGELSLASGDATVWFSAHPEAKPDLFDLEGSIFVSLDGQEAQIHDQMLHLAQVLCFDAVTAVLQTGSIEFTLLNGPVGVRLKRDGDQVEIVSNVFPAMTAPLKPVLEGLVACGEDFLSTATACWPNDGFDLALADIANAGKAAREALSTLAKKKPKP